MFGSILRPDTDFMELVWENGQIMMQGQSRKGPISSNFQTLAPKPQEGRNANGSKMAKCSTVDSISGDFPLPMPSCEMGLDHDDMVPWLNYSIEDPPHNEYTSDFLRELSGVTMNDLSTENHLASREKKTSFQGNGHSLAIDNGVSLKHGNTSKPPSSTEKHMTDGSGEVPRFSLPFQHNIPISRNINGSSHQVASRESFLNPSSLCAFTSMRLQKLDRRQPSTSSGFTNFPCISRHATLARANHVSVKGSNRPESDDQRLPLSSNNLGDSTLVNPSSGFSQKGMVSRNQSVLRPVNGNSESLPANPTEEVLSSKDKPREDAIKTDELQNLAHCARVTTDGMAGERKMEPVVAASSVCSGNSVERASNKLVRGLKRKSRDTGESDDPSEEVEEDSVGARKAPPARAGSKRTRAAEVHNLSERRRRDRINEKMRALQELIPNCNKVDKASMLDEAIEYLKTLQLQVQMLSMGSGLYMPPMMLPHIQGAHMPHFSHMGIGMGLGMGLGFNMLDMNSSMKMIPFQGLHYPIPNPGPAYHGMPGSSFQAYGHPGQGMSMPVQRPPVLPASGAPSLNLPVGPNVLSVTGSTNPAALVPSSRSKDIGHQVLHSNNVESSTNQAPNQLTKEGIVNPPASHDEAQAAMAAIATEAMPS